jgi:hypothetical protein
MGFLLTDFLTYLTPIELRLLKLTCHAYNDAITTLKLHQPIINEIKNRLTIFPTPLIDLLKTVNAYVSGSLIIQSALNVDYLDSDIDIYIPYTKQVTSIMDNFIKYTVINDSYMYDDQELNSDCIVRVVDYFIDTFNEKTFEVIESRKLQLIYFTGEFDIFIKHFDFDLCKNYYDLKNNLLYMNNINYILDKKFTFCIGEWQLNKTIDRARKYINRGFKMINPYSCQQIVEQYEFSVKEYHVKLLYEDDEYKYCEFNDIIDSCIKEYIDQDDKIIKLSIKERSTKIDYILDLLYPNGNYLVYWCGYCNHYVFIIK